MSDGVKAAIVIVGVVVIALLAIAGVEFLRARPVGAVEDNEDNEPDGKVGGSDFAATLLRGAADALDGADNVDGGR